MVQGFLAFSSPLLHGVFQASYIIRIKDFQGFSSGLLHAIHPQHLPSVLCSLDNLVRHNFEIPKKELESKNIKLTFFHIDVHFLHEDDLNLRPPPCSVNSSSPPPMRCLSGASNNFFLYLSDEQRKSLSKGFHNF